MADMKVKSDKRKAEATGITDIIRSDKAIRLRIAKAIELNDLRYTDLINAAEGAGIALSKASLSRYLSSAEQAKGIPTQEAILWICKFLKIKVNVNVE